MFKLYQLIKDEIVNVERRTELPLHQKIEASHYLPLNLEMTYKNSEIDIILKVSLNLKMRNGLFTIQFNQGLPQSLLEITQNYCEKINMCMYGDKSTTITSIYSKHYIKNFCTYFNAVDDYFTEKFKDKSPLFCDRMFRCFDTVRDCLSLPKRQRILSLQACCWNTLFKMSNETGRDLLSTLPETVQDEIKNSM